MFNFYLKEMREKGSLKKILDKYESPPQVCPDYNGKPLGFGAVFTAFGVLGLGVIAGILLFLLEGFSALTSKKLINQNNIKFWLQKKTRKNSQTKLFYMVMNDSSSSQKVNKHMKIQINI